MNKHITYFKKKKKKKQPWERGLKVAPGSNFRLIPKPSKLKNQSCTCFARHTHQSVHEANVCNRLFAMVRAKEIKQYIIQKRFPIYVKKVHICDHYVDFFVTNNDGSVKIVEAKGFCTKEWVLKHKLTKVCYPKIPYEIIVERDRWNTSIKSIRGLRILGQT